jgi:hypothetical protein
MNITKHFPFNYQSVEKTRYDRPFIEKKKENSEVI